MNKLVERNGDKEYDIMSCSFLYIIEVIWYINIGDIMYYINSFLVYSVLGFLLESTWYKILQIDNYSGFLFGPCTPIYGFGALCILIIERVFIRRIKGNRIVKGIISFLVFAVLLSVIELLGGVLLEKILGITLWDYSNKPWHLGKYVCLELSLVWGFGSLLFIYVVKPFMDKMIKKIPVKATYTFMGILIVDLVMSYLRYKGVI